MIPRRTNAWIAALIAAFMTFVLPACWVGALMRARAMQSTPLSSNNNEEEREHGEERDGDDGVVLGTRPPPAPKRAPRVVIVTNAPAIELTPTIMVSVAEPADPNILTVRQLI